MTRLRAIFIVLVIAVLIAAPLGQGNYIIYTLCSWLLFSISAMGLNLTLGYAGQVSLAQAGFMGIGAYIRSEEHTSELQSLMRISYAVFCLKKKNNNQKK